MKMTLKLNELYFEWLRHPAYSPDLVSSDYWLFADLKKILQRKKFGAMKKLLLNLKPVAHVKFVVV